MEIKQLRHFEAVCRCRSFARAAQDCYISAQGISLSISRLEDEIGCRLFSRTPQGIELTDAGSYLLPKAEQILSVLDECAEHFSGASDGRRPVSVMFVRGTVERLARNAVKRFNATMPEVPLQMHVGTDRECESAVISGAVDIGVCAGPVDCQLLEAVPLFSGKNVLVVSREHPLSRLTAIEIPNLRGIPLAIMSSSSNSTRALFELAKRCGIRLDYSYIDDPRLAVYMAEMGLRCGVINSVSAGKLCTPGLCAVPFADEEMDWNIFLISSREGRLSPEAALFKRLLLNK